MARDRQLIEREPISNGFVVTFEFTGPDGTTTYTYAAPTGAAQKNALTSITNPDGTHSTFTYDSERRLATQSGDNGVGLQTYSYGGAGEVTVTDAPARR